MNIKFIIEKEERKTLAKKIAELTGAEIRYLGVPSCAYQIGNFNLSKDAVLICNDRTENEVIEKVLNRLTEVGYTTENEPEKLTVQMPADSLSEPTINRIRRILENKEKLFKAALRTDSLEIEITETKVNFPWFTIEEDGDADAYSKFISLLCEFAKNQKRINNKPDTSDNEKYAFRCFLLRIGMIGAEYKAARKVLLRDLTGSAAFRHGRPEGETENGISE